MLPVLYEFPEAMQKDRPSRGATRRTGRWSRRTWPLDRPAAPDRPSALDEEAKGDGALRTWASQHLNIEIGMALHSDRWAGADFWERQGTEPCLTLESLLERSRGRDGRYRRRRAGRPARLGALGREIGTGRWLSWSHAWAHPIAIERRKSEESRYRDLEAAGDLTIIEELPGDVSQVAAKVALIWEAGLLASVGMDPEKTHKIMLQALTDLGIPEEICFGISQGWKLVGAMTVTERKLAEGELVHAGQPLMAWCVTNAKVEPKGNASLITKQASRHRKDRPADGAVQRRDPHGPEPRRDGHRRGLRADRRLKDTTHESTPVQRLRAARVADGHRWRIALEKGCRRGHRWRLAARADDDQRPTWRAQTPKQPAQGPGEAG
jgi:hypothetical protein